MTKRLPDFYIIGAMKCATSTLHEQLASREAFFMSTPKEPNFFSDALAVDNALVEYETLFAAARPEEIIGESSTHYTKLPTFTGTAERIRGYTPNAKFVYVMRHPLDRLTSQYIHEWTQREVRGSFDQAVQVHERFVAYSCYARQLAPFIRNFGRDKILPVFFEHLTREPLDELERVARFLGDTTTEPFYWHEEAENQNVSKDRMRKSRLRKGILKLPLVRPLTDALPSSWRQGLKSHWKMSERPRLSADVERHVIARLDEDLLELGALLGLKLDCEIFTAIASQTTATWAPSSFAA